jgi:hypothetical protein
MNSQKYNPEFRVDGHDCDKCPLPKSTLACLMEAQCGYAENMKAADLKALEAAEPAKPGPWGAGDEHQKALGGAQTPLPPIPELFQVGKNLKIEVASGGFGDFPLEFRESLSDALGDLFAEASKKDEPTPSDDPEPSVNTRLVKEVLEFLKAPSPEGFMRDRLKDSLDEVRVLIERSVMMAKSFGWDHVEIELVNVCDFLGRASSALAAVVIKDAKKS